MSTTNKDEIINQLLDKINELVKEQKQILDALEHHDNDFYNHEESGL